MFRIRRLLSRIASIAMMATAIAPHTNAMSSSGPSSVDPIAEATRHHNWIFAGYIFSGFLVAVMTYLVARSGNRVQDAVRQDADARIAEAKAEGAKANERAERLEQENIGLRRDLNTESGKVAVLQVDASNAKAAQQRVELDLSRQQEATARAEKDVAGLKRAAAEQQERAAKAERELLEIKERLKHRTISADQREQLIKLLTSLIKPVPINLHITSVIGDSEGHEFALQVDAVLKASGFATEGTSSGVFSPPTPIGLGILVRDFKTAPAYVSEIQRAFLTAGIPMPAGEDSKLPEGRVEIIVGLKPNRP